MELPLLRRPLSPRQSTTDSPGNPETDSNTARAFHIIAIVCSILMGVAVLLRLYIRFRVTRNPWWDDVAVVLALISQTLKTAFTWRAGSVGLGTHMSEINREDLAAFSDLTIPISILLPPGLFFTKFALLLLYLRLFSQNHIVKRGIWIGIIVCLLFYAPATLLYIFMREEGTHRVKMTYAVAVTGPVTDVYIISLPLLAVAQLHLDMRTKARVAAVFLTGLLAVAMSFLGCIYRFTLNLTDPTYSLLAIYTVNTVEVDIGIICCCLPLTPALFRKRRENSPWPSTFRSMFGPLGARFLRLSGPGSGSGSAGSRATNSPRWSSAGYTQFVTLGLAADALGLGLAETDALELVNLKMQLPSSAAATATTIIEGQALRGAENRIEQQQ